jgi:hypothetical protein
MTSPNAHTPLGCLVSSRATLPPALYPAAIRYLWRLLHGACTESCAHPVESSQFGLNSRAFWEAPGRGDAVPGASGEPPYAGRPLGE